MSAQQKPQGIKYDSPTRKYIRSLILKEFQENGPKFNKRQEFAKHVKSVLNAKGVKAPDGKNPISEQQAYSQVCMALKGILPEKGDLRPPAALAHVATDTRAFELNKATEKVPPAMKAILLDETLTPEQRLRMVAAFFGV